jgi:hypothetical protein
MQCINVDFPDPDGPMTAVNWPRSKVTLTSLSARTAVCAVPYVLVRFSARAACVSTAAIPVMPQASPVIAQKETDFRTGLSALRLIPASTDRLMRQGQS